MLQIQQNVTILKHQVTFQSEHPDISFTEFLIYAFELTSKWRQFNVRAFCKFFKITQQKIQKMPPGLTSLDFYCNIQEVESKCKQPGCHGVGIFS